MAGQRRTPTATVVAVLLAIVALASISPAVAVAVAVAASPAPSPFAATALWVARVPAGATAQNLAGEAAQAGVHTLFVKAADGSTPDAQFSPTLTAGLRAAGMTVCGWTFAYGQNPLGEAAAAVAAVRAGAGCLVVDAEGQYDKLYGPAQVFVKALRSQLGSRFPIGLAGQAEVSQHPTFPYSVFLGPGGFDYDLPQIYWLDLGASVDGAYAATSSVASASSTSSLRPPPTWPLSPQRRLASSARRSRRPRCGPAPTAIRSSGRRSC